MVVKILTINWAFGSGWRSQFCVNILVSPGEILHDLANTVRRILRVTPLSYL
jgi:hypothetical protein